MTVTPTSPASQTTSLYTTTTPSTAAKKELDQEVFLSLLVAQLRNQDPTSPMDTNEMMAQSTQLASMEQLTAVADTSRDQFGLQMRMAASNLIGQQVGFTDAAGVAHTGTVAGAAFDGAVPTVTIGEWTVPLDSISSIKAPTPTPPVDTATDAGSDPSSSASTAA